MKWHIFQKILLIIIAGILSIFLIILGVIYCQSKIDETRSVDAIVVLGASQWDGRPSPMFQARLDRAFNLYSNGYAPYVVLTGGFGEGDIESESNVGKMYLTERGMPKEAIFIEEQSRTTLQNLQNARNILNSLSVDSVLLVSHDFHMMRSKKIAYDLGMQAFVSPVETRSSLQKLKFSIREATMYLMYFLFRK